VEDMGFIGMVYLQEEDLGGILLGVNKETYDVVDKQMGVYYVRFLIASKKDYFTWNLVVVYGDAQ
jgi:hypothetical protein